MPIDYPYEYELQNAGTVKNPRDRGTLQEIRFAVVSTQNSRARSWRWYDVDPGETVRTIARKLKHPEDARLIADKNKIRSVNSKFRTGGRGRIQVPMEDKASNAFFVLPGDSAPQITGGYQKLSSIDRPGVTGLTKFDGYDPIQMSVPIRFEALDRNGVKVENDIAILEKMAGRGINSVHGNGAAPIISVETTKRDGKEIVPLIPANYQSPGGNSSAPVWRVANIDWDADPWRNKGGNRIRQLAVVTLREFTPISLVSRSSKRQAPFGKPKGK